ncbi:MAG: ribosome recycling factor [Thermoleophilaceae bacterium]|nr:ribosome recycling factor [Thermoleophilaceae bacterium]
MVKSVQSTSEKMGTVRTGRASPSLLDRVTVDYYGTSTPLNQLSNIAATEARLLTVTPFDKTAMATIEKAITEADLGLTPNNDGNVIRLQIPDLTSERRADMVKVARQIAEEGRIAIRNIRREIMHDLKALRESGEAGEDDEKRAESEMQKITDRHIGEIDSQLKNKESDLTEV